MDHFQLRRLEPGDADTTVQMWRDSYRQALGIEPMHNAEAQKAYLLDVLLPNYSVLLALDNERPVGLLVCDAEWVEQLYVAPGYQGQGIGSQLLAWAKSESCGHLQLRTFAHNQVARSFYQHHGFVAIGGDSDNEEGLPDILYRWQTDTEEVIQRE